MSRADLVAAMAAWLKTRPPVIQAAAVRWPLNSVVALDDGEQLYVFGYAENDQTKLTGRCEHVTLILTPISPFRDYDAAKAARIYLCADHVQGDAPPFTATREHQHQVH